VRIPLKGGTRPDDDRRMISTPLSALDLTATRSARVDIRVGEIREAVRSGTYEAPAELVAEAILAASLIGLPPNPLAVAWLR
jgi:anti-sigma28 factor (negative regulator of flagellin synthesis)